MEHSPKVTPLDLHIAGRVKSLRTSAKDPVRLTVIAAHLGVTYQSYQKMEAGRFSWRASTLSKLAEFYGVPVSYFYEDGPVPATPNQEEVGVCAMYLRCLSSTDARALTRQVATWANHLGA